MSDHLSWKLLGSRFVRQHRIYDGDSMRWSRADDPAFSDCLVAGSPYGGTLAVTRDTTKLLETRGASDDDILVYSPAGQIVRCAPTARPSRARGRASLTAQHCAPLRPPPPTPSWRALRARMRGASCCSRGLRARCCTACIL